MIKKYKTAQIFEVNNDFSPTKASLLLLPSLFNNEDFFNISLETIIDSSNFSGLIDATQRIFFTDEESGYSGAGYLIYPTSIYTSVNPDDFNIVNYPVKNNGSNSIYIRIKDIALGGTCDASTFLDDVIVSSTSIATTGNWEWISLGNVNITDDVEHNIGIRIEKNGIAYDQIAINLSVPPASGDAYTETISPYVTVHANIYEVDANLLPTTPVLVYDFKTSILDILQDGWYNFNLNFIDSSVIFSYTGSYALVLSVSGSNSENYISWESQDSVDNIIEPSAYKD